MKKITLSLLTILLFCFSGFSYVMDNDILVIDFSPSTTNLLYDLQSVLITNNSLIFLSSLSYFKITNISVRKDRNEVFKNLYINVDLTPSTVLEMNILDPKRRINLYTDFLTSSSKNYFYDLEALLPKGTEEIYFIFTCTTSSRTGGRVKLITLTKDVSLQSYVRNNEVKVYPNPVFPKLNQFPKIVVNIPRESYVNLVVFDSMGNVVKRFVDNKLMEEGIYTFNWDLKDDRGFDLSSGKYVVFLSVDNIQSTTMLLVVR